MKRFALFIMAFLCACSLNALDKSGKIEVLVTNLRNSNGKIGINLFSGKKGFPAKHEAALKKVFSDIKDNSCTVIFEDVPYGAYAVSVFHDENVNLKLDTTIIGMPKEGVGASNNAKGRFGPPKYKDASFLLDSNEKTIHIVVEYLK